MPALRSLIVLAAVAASLGMILFIPIHGGALLPIVAFFIPIDLSKLQKLKEGKPKPGSPDYTESIAGDALPPPPGKFGGEIKSVESQSKSWWPPTVVAPEGAPNVLLILMDDAGYGAASTFGGVIPTPTMDKLAENGLRYTMFHSASLCSPSRAAIITGRNHHTVGFGVVSEAATGFPGYNSIITPEEVTVARILQGHGYATSWFGKNHNVPGWLQTQAGPFNQWPIGLGFDYFYGFIGGDTSQWQPNLTRNTTPIAPYVGNPGWNLIEAMADDAIDWLNQLNAVAPEKPFFVYYAPGATHAPHHPTPEWISKISAMHLFDKGWNAVRDQILANQKRLGVIPQNAELSDWPNGEGIWAKTDRAVLAEWDTLSDNEKKMFIRQADVYGAYLAYTDHEIGRVIQKIADIGKLDNTLIIYIGGDNGASPEGSTIGTPNEFSCFNGVVTPINVQLERYYDTWGSDKTFPHYAVGWAWTFNTPFKWTKQVASHFGGTRQGMVVSWPARIKDTGGLRHQFHHFIDIEPTILELCGITPPESVDGIKQKPIDGVSMAYTFDKANADVPSKRRTQYFEMLGLQGIYHDGWMASTTPPFVPWAAFEGWPQKAPKDIATGYNWELYNVVDDPSQEHDLAEKNPDKLAEMKKIFSEEAAKFDVYPLDNRALTRFLEPRPGVPGAGKRTVYTYTSPVSRIPKAGGPFVIDRSYRITADIEIPQGGAEGVLVTDGGRFGGYGLYLLKSRPVFVYNFLDLTRYRWEGAALSPGKHSIVYDFVIEGIGFGHGGTGTLSVDGSVVDSKKQPRTLPFLTPEDEFFDVGLDTGTPVDDTDYQVPFPFTGKLEKLTVELGDLKATLAEIIDFKIESLNY